MEPIAQKETATIMCKNEVIAKIIITPVERESVVNLHSNVYDVMILLP